MSYASRILKDPRETYRQVDLACVHLLDHDRLPPFGPEVGQALPHPVQVVRSRVEVPFRREDWRGLDDAGREARREAYLEEDRRAGFELSRAPLMRLDHVLVGEGIGVERFELLEATASDHLGVEAWLRVPRS